MSTNNDAAKENIFRLARAKRRKYMLSKRKKQCFYDSETPSSELFMPQNTCPTSSNKSNIKNAVNTTLPEVSSYSQTTLTSYRQWLLHTHSVHKHSDDLCQSTLTNSFGRSQNFSTESLKQMSTNNDAAKENLFRLARAKRKQYMLNKRKKLCIYDSVTPSSELFVPQITYPTSSNKLNIENEVNTTLPEVILDNQTTVTSYRQWLPNIYSVQKHSIDLCQSTLSNNFARSENFSTESLKQVSLRYEVDLEENNRFGRAKRKYYMLEKRKNQRICVSETQTDCDIVQRSNVLSFPNTKKASSNDWLIRKGDPDFKCQWCSAFMWFNERVHKRRQNQHKPKFNLCCGNSKVKLPLMSHPPEVLKNLIFGVDSRSKNFLVQIRQYNSMFSFTSMGGKIDQKINNGKGPYVFKIQGKNCHRIGSMLPRLNEAPKFAQLYIYDTDNETKNRVDAIRAGDSIDLSIVDDLRKMLDEHNVLSQSFRVARDRIKETNVFDFKMRLIGRRNHDGRTYNMPTIAEVAGIVVNDIGVGNDLRDIILECKNGGSLKRINELHPSYLALQYPLLFPYGEDGFRKDIMLSDDKKKKREVLSMREYFCYRIMQRDTESMSIFNCKKLFQQFLVDIYTMVEAERLLFIRFNQKTLRADLYKGLTDAICRGDINPSSVGKRIILPSSFTGGARYMIQNYQDAMTICKWIGYPDLFITFTCNTKWPEIKRFVESYGLKPEDRPDIVARIFKMKLDALLRYVQESPIFGHVMAVVYTIEFQKRGLPHAHILLFLHKDDKPTSPEDINKIISAEIPDKATDAEIYNLVSNLMVHGPCGNNHPHSPCMVDAKCSKHFPKKFVNETTIDDRGYPIYRRRDDGRTIRKGDLLIDNTFIVPYNPQLLLKFNAHINVAWCNQNRSIKYLFKFVHKGNNMITTTFYQNTDNGECIEVADEVKMYYNCRCVSPCEAVWRLLAFTINYRNPSVERLSFHLPNEQNVVFKDNENIVDVVERYVNGRSMFLQWMEANKKYEEAKDLTYVQFPQKFVWKDVEEFDPVMNKTLKYKRWCLRKRTTRIGRIFYVHPGAGELYYLRILLNIVRGCKSYEEIRTINGIVHPTFKEACFALGLLDDDQQYVNAIVEASHWCSGYDLRRLFVIMLMLSSMTNPKSVWDNTWQIQCNDILHKQRQLLQKQDLELSDDQLKIFALVDIEKMLNKAATSLKNIDGMPLPDVDLMGSGINNLIDDELSYDRKSLAEESMQLIAKLNVEQEKICDSVMTAVHQASGEIFFVYGCGGTGKTFIWRALTATLRSKGDIVLTVASSGIAALLIPGGRTAHSRFCILISINEDSTCNIKQRSHLAELIIRAKLIIWDEAPMMHRHCYEALDRTFRDILRFTNADSMSMPFGGKVVVFGGDFRQILPVIAKGRRQEIVNTSLNSSYLWRFFKVLTLSENMRLMSHGSAQEQDDIKWFSEWMLNIGEGKVGGQNDGDSEFEVPKEFLIKAGDDPIRSIVESTYPNLWNTSTNLKYLKERAILAPTLEIVNQINEYVLSRWPGEDVTYLSSDSVYKPDYTTDCAEDVYTPEFLNSITTSGLPNHKLNLKVGVPVMLLRNIDQTEGLCNGTRLM